MVASSAPSHLHSVRPDNLKCAGVSGASGMAALKLRHEALTKKWKEQQKLGPNCFLQAYLNAKAH